MSSVFFEGHEIATPEMLELLKQPFVLPKEINSLPAKCVIRHSCGHTVRYILKAFGLMLCEDPGELCPACRHTQPDIRGGSDWEMENE